MAERYAYQTAFTPDRAVQLVPANPNRLALVIKTAYGTGHFGADRSVTAATGLPLGEGDGPYVDPVPGTDPVWVIGGGWPRAAQSGTAYAWETSDGPPPIAQLEGEGEP